jgi:hypothetical protein
LPVASGDYLAPQPTQKKLQKYSLVLVIFNQQRPNSRPACAGAHVGMNRNRKRVFTIAHKLTRMARSTAVLNQIVLQLKTGTPSKKPGI